MSLACRIHFLCGISWSIVTTLLLLCGQTTPVPHAAVTEFLITSHSRSSRLFSAFRHSTGSQMGKECYHCTASSPEPGSPGLLTDAGCLRRHAAYLFSDTAFLASKQPFYPLSFGHTRNASLFTSSPCHPFLMSFILCLSGIRFPNQASGFAS